MICRCGHDLDQHSTEMDIGDGEVENAACNLCSCLAFQELEASESQFGIVDLACGLGPAVIGCLFLMFSRPSIQTFVVVGLIVGLFWLIFRCKSDPATFTAAQEKRLRNEFRNMRKPRRLV